MRSSLATVFVKSLLFLCLFFVLETFFRSITFVDDEVQGNRPWFQALVSEEIRYNISGAGDVWLMWGINGWKAVPDGFRPPGTVLTEKKAMKTPMVRERNAFTTTVRVPPGTTLDYGIWVGKTNAGAPLGTWEGIEPKVVRANGRTEIEAKANPITPEQRKNWLSGLVSDLPLVTQEIHYHVEGASEVWLAWGVDGWHAVPEAFRPSGTYLKNRVMHTPLVRKEHGFATTLRLPPGTKIDCGFLITKTESGTSVNVWEYCSDRPSSVKRIDGRIEVEPKMTSVTTAPRKAWLAGQVTDLPLISQDIMYRDPGAAEVWLEWGLDEWKAIPVAARPPNTLMKDGIMNTSMSRNRNLFTATVQVPAGAVIDYKFSITKQTSSSSDQQADARQIGTFVVQFDNHIQFDSEFSKDILEQRKVWTYERLTALSLVTQEIRYRIAGADEVWLVWGINGWQWIPEDARPPGTILKDNQIMHSRMIRTGDTFSTTVRVPPKTVLNFKFLITKTSRGVPVSIWQDFNGQDFWKLVRETGTLEEKATVTVVTMEQRKTWLTGEAVDLSLVTEEIRYHAPGAGEVWLRWGLDGWQSVPEKMRPPATVLNENKLMHTRMVRTGDMFIATVRVPPGTRLDFVFLITKTDEGKVVDLRQSKGGDGRAFGRVVSFDDKIDVHTNAWLSFQTADRPLVTQEIRYRVGGADEVWLVWGINDWQAIPEAAQPLGTVLKDNRVMHSRMVRKGDAFAATVRVPVGTLLDYKFLITKTSSGAPVSIWQDNDGQDFQKKLVRGGGTVEEKATVSVLTLEQRQAWLAGQGGDLPLVAQQLRYRAPGAAEVWLVWGHEGWHAIPEAARPKGTVLKHGRLQTPMVRDGTTFSTTVRLPPGTEFNFLFLIAKTEEGNVVDIRQEKDGEGRTLSRVVAFDDRIEVLSEWKNRF